MPKAPACKDCNNKKSWLEHYLLTVLPLGGRHSQAAANLQQGVPKRLAKNQKLHRELSGSAEHAWLKTGGGIYQPSGSVKFDGNKLGQLLKYVSRGLTWHHWGIYVSAEHKMRVLFSPDMFSLYLQSQLSAVQDDRKITIDLGRGTVQYAGCQVGEPPDLTFWGISMYGGVMVSNNTGSTAGPEETSCQWWVITAPPELGDALEGRSS